MSISAISDWIKNNALAGHRIADRKAARHRRALPAVPPSSVPHLLCSLSAVLLLALAPLPASAQMPPDTAPSATISATNPDRLTEINLDMAMLTVTLANTTYMDPLPDTPFTLGGSPAGVTVTNFRRDSNTVATLTLGYGGTDFDTAADLTVGRGARRHRQPDHRPGAGHGHRRDQWHH